MSNRGYRGGFNPYRDEHGRYAAAGTAAVGWANRTGWNGQPRDSFTAQHWNGGYAEVTRASGTDAQLHQTTHDLFGRDVGLTELADLTGAPDGARVSIQPLGGALTMTIQHPWYSEPSVRTIQKNASGELVLTNSLLHLRPDTPPGAGTRILAHQVRAASEMGLHHIQAPVSGSFNDDHYNGYYTFPRLGFDFRLSSADRAYFQGRGFNVERVSDLMQTPEGREAWKRDGAGAGMTFDLADGSRSRRVLAAYVEAKGYNV